MALNIHEMPPSPSSMPTAIAGVPGHLFRIHASRMSVLFWICEAQIQKYNAAILYRMAMIGSLMAWRGNTLLDRVSGSAVSPMSTTAAPCPACLKVQGLTSWTLVSISPTIYPQSLMCTLWIGERYTLKMHWRQIGSVQSAANSP